MLNGSQPASSLRSPLRTRLLFFSSTPRHSYGRTSAASAADSAAAGTRNGHRTRRQALQGPSLLTASPSQLTLPSQVCTGFKAWTGAHKKVPKAGTAAAGAALAATATPATLPSDCPPDVERLGRHTWTFLHTTASYYPLTPSPFQRTSMLSLLTALPTLYPCSSCAEELGKYMKVHPPEKAVEGREGLERWLCEVHNEVNTRLGKEEFDCGNVGQRWRDGWKDGRCD